MDITTKIHNIWHYLKGKEAGAHALYAIDDAKVGIVTKWQQLLAEQPLRSGVRTFLKYDSCDVLNEIK